MDRKFTCPIGALVVLAGIGAGPGSSGPAGDDRSVERAGATVPSPQSPEPAGPYGSPSPQTAPAGVGGYGGGGGGATGPGTAPVAIGAAAGGLTGGGVAGNLFGAEGGGGDQSGTFSPAAGGVLGGGGGAFNMIGDQGPITLPPGSNLPPGSTHTPSSLSQRGGRSIPFLRGFKIADNQSPMPQDRVFFNFNYFDNVNAALNRRFNAPISDVQAFRYQFGIEKTFLDGRASFGVRDSVNNVSAHSLTRPPLGGTSTAMGDLNVFTKFILFQRWDGAAGAPYAGAGGGFLAPGGVNGFLVSGGLALTLPTGPSSFAGASYLRGFRNTQIQPYLGYLAVRGNFYVQGFEAINVPTDPNDVTLLFNDLGIGYFVYRNPDASFLTALAPTLEVHANIPLNHRDVSNVKDKGGTQDVVDLTYGLNALFGQRTMLTTALVTPVTGPKPFDLEVVAYLNVFFGARRSAYAGTPPVVGR